MFIALSINGVVTVPWFILDDCVCTLHCLKVFVD